MKKIQKIMFSLFLGWMLFMGNPWQGKAATNPYSPSGPYGTNCTWYAWNMAYERAGVALPGFGNAKDWYSDARNAGYSVGTTPQANSIIVWGGWTSYGHVGYVESVEGNILHVWDSTGPCIDRESEEFQNCMAQSVNEDTDRVCYQNAKRIACEYTISPDQYGITGYIYLNSAPKTTAYSKNTSPSQPTPTPEPLKSNNTNLKKIELSSGNLTFKPDVFEYQVTVENSVNEIEIKAEVEDEKATVEGTGKHVLTIGPNEVTLTVKAEDGTTKEYKLTILRKMKEVSSVASENIASKSPSLFLIEGGIGLGILGLLLIIFFLKKKRKNTVKGEKEKKDKK